MQGTNMFEKLPSSFRVDYVGLCGSCGSQVSENITYNLNIAPVVHSEIKNYNIMKFKMWYEPQYYKVFMNSPKVIGLNVGVGLPLLEAISELSKTVYQFNNNNN